MQQRGRRMNIIGRCCKMLTDFAQEPRTTSHTGSSILDTTNCFCTQRHVRHNLSIFHQLLNLILPRVRLHLSSHSAKKCSILPLAHSSFQPPQLTFHLPVSPLSHLAGHAHKFIQSLSLSILVSLPPCQLSETAARQ